MTAGHPAYALPGGGDYRCRHTWRGEVGTHVCWEPPGHEGPHRCSIGRCAGRTTAAPQTTTTREDQP